MTKQQRLLNALNTVREMTDEIEQLHREGLTYREVDEVMFGTEPGHHEDISGKITHANSQFSWLRRFAKYVK